MAQPRFAGYVIGWGLAETRNNFATTVAPKIFVLVKLVLRDRVTNERSQCDSADILIMVALRAKREKNVFVRISRNNAVLQLRS